MTAIQSKGPADYPCAGTPGDQAGSARGSGMSPIFSRSLTVSSLALFLATYSLPLNSSEDGSLGVMREEGKYCGRCGAE